MTSRTIGIVAIRFGGSVGKTEEGDGTGLRFHIMTASISLSIMGRVGFVTRGSGK